MADTNPSVIIIGAGPVGLYMAHAMERANIEYVLLDQKRSVSGSWGQLLFTWPHTVRLFDQIGVADKLKTVAFEMHQKKRVFGEDGHITSTNHFWDAMEHNHGYSFLPLLRSELIRILHESLKGKETNIRTNAEVTDIQTHSDGVRVQTKDGSIFEGSIVVGADGVHRSMVVSYQSGSTTADSGPYLRAYSTTRKFMQKLARTSSHKHSFDDPMVSSFYGIFGRASNRDLMMEAGTFFESRGAGAVIQCLATKDLVNFVTLKPLPEPMTGRKRYSNEEMEEYASSVAEVAICPGVKFKDVWAGADRTTTIMLNQEEGFMSRWHYGRMVLVGDAAHKSTSVNGLGMTCGLHSAAVLANELYNLFTAHSHPSNILVGEALSRYQEQRHNEVKKIWNRGHSMIREVTRRAWSTRMWDEYILPWVDVERLAWGLVVSVMLIRHGRTLSYVPFVGEEAWVPWTHRPMVQP